MKPCRDCLSEIRDDARFCHHCHSWQSGLHRYGPFVTCIALLIALVAVGIQFVLTLIDVLR